MSNTTNNNEITVSNQITVYKTDKKLLEFIDKLNGAPVTNYAHIHAQADDAGNGRRLYSLIGLVLQDYSKGKGENTVRVKANISPGEAKFICSRAAACVQNFEFASEKIFGDKDSEGYSKVTKLKIIRATVGSDGKARKYPWYVECENGKGIAVKNTNGGSYCKSGSYKSESKVYLNLSDLDFFIRISEVASYIAVWESQYGAAVMINGRNELEAQYAALAEKSSSAA